MSVRECASKLELSLCSCAFATHKLYLVRCIYALFRMRLESHGVRYCEKQSPSIMVSSKAFENENRI